MLNNATSISVIVTGVGTIAGFPACTFSLSGNGTIENDALTIPYTGTTCVGPVHGTETLRRHTDPPPEPVPDPPAPESPADNPHHVGPGPLSVDRAKAVVDATAAEFPSLTAVYGSDGEAVAAADQLLLRTIWHLQLAGYDAGRQRNPSGAISSDKLTINIDGRWHAYDIFSLGYAGVASRVIFLEVFPANPIADGGIPD